MADTKGIAYVINLGKIDYEGRGKVNLTTIEVELFDGNLSLVGNIWNNKTGSHRDIVIGGQIQDELRSLFSDNEKVQHICDVWDRWHLNDMKAGTPEQEELVRSQQQYFRRQRYYDAAGCEQIFTGTTYDHYGWACELLRAHGLYCVQLNGEDYYYGHRWLKEELPISIIEEVQGGFDLEPVKGGYTL